MENKYIKLLTAVPVTAFIFAFALCEIGFAQTRDSKQTEDIINHIQNNSETGTPQKIKDAEQNNTETKNTDLTQTEEETSQTKNKTDAASNDSALFKTGINLFNSGSYENAAKTLETIINDFPQSPHADSAKVYRGKIFIKKREYDRAISELSTIEEGSGEYPTALYDTAYSLNARGDIINAISYYQTVAYRFPDHELADNALLQSGILLSKTGKGNEAIAAFLQLSAQYKDRETVDDALFFMGKVFESDPSLRDIERARDIYKLFLQKSRDGVLHFKDSPLRDRAARDLRRIEETYFRIRE